MPSKLKQISTKGSLESCRKLRMMNSGYLNHMIVHTRFFHTTKGPVTMQFMIMSVSKFLNLTIIWSIQAKFSTITITMASHPAEKNNHQPHYDN